MVRFLTERRCVAPLTLDDVDDVGDCYEGNSVRTMPYLKLPQTRIRLSVLKLDGSRFDVYIERNATVGELRQAIEEVFTLSPMEGQGKISWTNVWGHFCLCYDGRKLVNDKTHIRDFRMKDGDEPRQNAQGYINLGRRDLGGELQFSRHMSLDYLHSKRRSKTQNVACQQFSRLSVESDTCEQAVLAKDNLEDQHNRLSPGSDAEEEKKHDLADRDSLGNQDDSYKYYQHQDHEEIPVPGFKLAHFLKGWLSYSKLRGVSRKSTEGKSRPSRFALRCLAPPRMIQL
ncbi:hypothetical protein WN943_022515 [Citrus x changshan-huyou]